MVYQSWPTITRHWKRTRAWHSYPMVALETQTLTFPSIRKKSSSKCRLEGASPVSGPSGVTSESKKTSAGSSSTEDNKPSDGRIQSTKRKDAVEEMQKDSSDSSPRKRQCKVHLDTSSADEEREDWSGLESGSDVRGQRRRNRLLFSSLSPVVIDSQSAYGVLSSDSSEFDRKYKVISELRTGGYGEVCTGVRTEDNLPVAIKHILKIKVCYIDVVLDEAVTRIPLEVYLLFKVGAGQGSAGSTVTPRLLDWYNMGVEIVLVLERPAPCMDLFDYIQFKNRYGLDEKETRILFRQLVEAAIEMDSRGVFHRDIKAGNVLIETGNDVRKARFIDFGCGRPCKPGQLFHDPQGTPQFASPEWFRDRPYRAGSTTVWQLGLLLYVMLFNKRPLITEESIGSKRSVPIPYTLTSECRDLLKGCLQKNPRDRLSLQNIREHTWLNPE